MKTRLKVIPQIQAPCPWRRFGRSSEKRRSGDTTFCMSILFSILIVSLLRFSQTCEFWSSKAAFTIPFLTAVNHLNGPLRKQNFTLTGSKGHGLWFVISEFRSISCVCVFQGSLLVIVIMIDGSEKRSCEGGFCTLEFACLWKAQ